MQLFMRMQILFLYSPPKYVKTKFFSFESNNNNNNVVILLLLTIIDKSRMTIYDCV